MTIVLADSVQNDAADTIEIIYTDGGSGNGTVITAFTATNNTESNKTYIAYIFDSGGSVKEAIIPRTIIVRDRRHLGAGIVGQLIPRGGTLRVESSAANSIAFRVTGIQK